MNEHEICGRRGQPESLGGLQRGFRGRASERANRGRRQRGGAHLPKVCAVWGRVGARRRVASRPVTGGNRSCDARRAFEGLPRASEGSEGLIIGRRVESALE